MRTQDCIWTTSDKNIATVDKESLHVLLDITPDGTRKVLDYALYPTETAANYEEMMESIKKRGVKQVLLFASDGLAGMRDAVSAEILQLFEEKLQAAHKQDVV